MKNYTNELNVIDFTNGIRPEELQENFEILEDQLERERRNVGGPGIASGLEPIIEVDENNFRVKLTAASIITNDGKEVYIPETIVNIDPPKLIQNKEFLNSDYNNQVKLKYIPYASSRRTISQFARTYLTQDTGISINYQDAQRPNETIKITGIARDTLSLSRLTRRDVTVVYNYTAKRIDTLYVDSEYKIKVISGVTSTTPSAVIPSDFKFLIAFIEIDPYYNDNNNRLSANIILKKDLRKVRNIYTDKGGRLWICGTPFDSLQIIHMKEPAMPAPDTLWYDRDANQIKIWRCTDKLVYMNSFTVTTDYNANPEAIKDYKTDMYYLVGGNQLSIYVNDVKLSVDEFTELNELLLPADKLDTQRGIYSNMFRIFTDLKPGDKVVYKIKDFDKHYMWIPINNLSYINVKDTKMFGSSFEDNYFASEKALALGLNAQNYPNKYQYFFFHYKDEMNLLYTPDKNELEIMINQIPLHSDQFEEIVVADLYDDTKIPANIKTALEKYYGYTPEVINKVNNEYENNGIGFKLKDPLDVGLGEEINGPTDLYVEASITRRVNDSPFKRKLQRTATFINENDIQYVAETTQEGVVSNIEKVEDGYIVSVDGYYLYDENQLEVYLNGIKLLQSDIVQGIDLSDKPVLADPNNPDSPIIDSPPRTKGAKTKQFKIINKPLTYGDIITYKITINIYSYDHINDLIEEMEYDARTAVLKVDYVYDKTIAIQNKVEERFAEMDASIQEIKEIAENLDGKYMTKEEPIVDSQMPAWIVTNTPKSLQHISYKIVYKGEDNINVSDFMREEDYVICIKRNRNNNLDRIFVRGVDFDIVNTTDALGKEGSIIVLNKTESNPIEMFDELYFSGIKFSNAWRAK